MSCAPGLATTTAAVVVVLLVHDWYPSVCCANRDCRPVPCETIEEWQQKFSNWGLHAQSPDGRCHVCIGRGSGYPRCIFTPSPSPLIS